MDVKPSLIQILYGKSPPPPAQARSTSNLAFSSSLWACWRNVKLFWRCLAMCSWILWGIKVVIF